MKFTIRQFNDRFPTSDPCLEELKQLRFANFVCPKCERKDMLSKVGGRPQYQCPCGFQVSPLAGTIFHKSSTDLRTWFLAMYTVTQTRNGVSAKTIERTTGVTYKTAWRMMKQIRSLMTSGGDLLTGVVEVDETYVGGVQKGFTGRAAGLRKGIVMGMVERGGRVNTHVVPTAKGEHLLPIIRDGIDKTAIVYTDELRAYQALYAMGYDHDTVVHSRGQYAIGNVSTNTIESFWSLFKRGFRGTYIHCGKDYLQSYTNEYAWRYSHRKSEVPMFELLLAKTAN